MFNINFYNLINFLIPTALRRSKMIAWLQLILSYIYKIYNEFLDFRAKKLYDINFTGQTHYLEKKLNEVMQCEGIYIDDIFYVPRVYLFNKRENFLPVYFGNVWKAGVNYKQGDAIVYENYWYEYSGAGSGVTPDKDINAKKGERIPMLLGISELYYANDFIVYVPEDVFNGFSETDILRLKETVNYYKLAEMRFFIDTY